MSCKLLWAEVAVVGLLTTSCSGAESVLSGPRDEASVIIFYGDTSRISAPDTVIVGVPFEVTFSTFAGGCTRTVARTDVMQAAGGADVLPFDHNEEGTVCTADLLYLAHVAEVRLDVRGAAVVRVVGRQRPGPGGSGTGAVAIQQRVIVR